MANDSGNLNFNNYIDFLKLGIPKENPRILESILKTADENLCKITQMDQSFYIKKGDSPSMVLHLNIDNSLDQSYDFTKMDDEEYIISKSNINILAASFVIDYFLKFSVRSFDILITNANIQSKLEDFGQIKEVIRSSNIVNLNLRQADCVADEFSSLLLSLVSVPINRFKADYDYKTYRLSLSNLMGGHAGDTINKVRMNSIKMIIGIFRRMKTKVDLDMISLFAGDKYDNVPSFANIEFIINSAYENELINTFDIYKNKAIEKNLRYEPDMKLECEEIKAYDQDPITNESFTHLASFIELCPTGSFAVNSLDNQVISSSNLATTRTLKEYINLILVLRSLTEEGMSQMLEKSRTAAKIAGSNLIEKSFISSFKNKDKELTDAFISSYKTLYDEGLEVIKTQYSLESSIVFKNQNVKMVSLGVKYKQDDNHFYTNTKDLLDVINLLDCVMEKLENHKENLWQKH